MYRQGWDQAAFQLEKISREQGLQGIDYTKYYRYVMHLPPDGANRLLPGNTK